MDYIIIHNSGLLENNEIQYQIIETILNYEMRLKLDHRAYTKNFLPDPVACVIKIYYRKWRL